MGELGRGRRAALRPNSIFVELGLAFLGVKLVLSGRRGSRRLDGRERVPVDRLRVAVLVPVYNEDPAIIRRSIASILEQTRTPDVIHVIDDGSGTREALEAIEAELDSRSDRERALVRVSRHGTNLGKRQAIATGVRAEPEADIYVTVDSDTVLDPGATAALLEAFGDPDVLGATALVRVLNRGRNLLTRLIDLRYANAFLLDRGFQSAFGSVLCACGSLAAWRRCVLVDNLDDFVGQRFLGQRCTYGDDRRLTNYALTSGRVVLVPEAVALTAAPERLSHYVRQQVRWSRSFVRESMWAVMNLPLARPAMWLSLGELTGWVVFTGMVFYAVIFAPLAGGRFGLATCAAYAAIAAIMAWLRSIRSFDAGIAGEARRDRVVTFLIAPLYAVLHIVVLIPLRFVALSTLRTTPWGTRRTVEVSMARETVASLAACRRSRRLPSGMRSKRTSKRCGTDTCAICSPAISSAAFG